MEGKFGECERSNVGILPPMSSASLEVTTLSTRPDTSNVSSIKVCDQVARSQFIDISVECMGSGFFRCLTEP